MLNNCLEHEVRCRQTGNGSPHRNLKEADQKRSGRKTLQQQYVDGSSSAEVAGEELETSAVPNVHCQV